MASIGLAIIVRNEAKVIERCLASVRPLCDFFLVVDTGSDDATRTVVREYLSANGLSGEVVDCAWRDFAFNRNAALTELRGHAELDYCLMIDADEEIVYQPGFDPADFKQALDADIVDIQTVLGGVEYLRPQLFRNALPFAFRGVMHEYLVSPPAAQRRVTAEGFVNRPRPDGARSANPRKYEDDAAVLRAAIAGEADAFERSRYQFYLAQSLRDCGHHEAAFDAYRQRSEMGGWHEEVFVALYEMGKAGERVGRDPDEVVLTYLRAYEASPGRAESLTAAARLLRLAGRYALAYLFASRAAELAAPADALFLERAAYEWRAKDEAAVSAYWVAKYMRCVTLCDELLASAANIPEADRGRIAGNRMLALERMVELSRTESPAAD